MAIESGCMIGDPAISVFAEGYLSGIRGYDAEAAYALCRQTAEGPKTNRNASRPDMQLGYAPGQISETLENAYADYCAGRFAEALGKKDDAARFYRRAMNYRNIYDPSVGNMRAKDAKGNWLAWRAPPWRARAASRATPISKPGSPPRTCKA